MADYDHLETCDFETPHCVDCDFLIEALRDLEAQCREAEDQFAVCSTGMTGEQWQRVQSERSARLSKLEYRRNCALDILFKHQELEHRRS
jgi:hypothetical protein